MKLKLEKVFERDVDLLVLNKSLTDNNFKNIFLNKINVDSKYNVVLAEHSLADENGESDIISNNSDLYSYNDYEGVIASSSNAINLYRYKLGDAIKESIRTLSNNGMWQGGMLEQKKKTGVMIRGGNGDIKNASIYTTSIVDYDYEAPFRIVIGVN